MKRDKLKMYLVLHNGERLYAGYGGFAEMKMRMIDIGMRVVEKGKARDVVVLDSRGRELMSFSGFMERLFNPETREEEYRWLRRYEDWLRAEGMRDIEGGILEFPEEGYEEEEEEML